MTLKKYKRPFALKIHTLPGATFNRKEKLWEPCWHDRDVLLLHAAFQILIDFMEKENPGKVINWDSDRSHKRAWKEIQRLYTWYTQERPQRVDIWSVFYKQFKNVDWDTIPQDLKTCVVLKQGELDQQWYKEDTQNLIALMKIREYLWT